MRQIIIATTVILSLALFIPKSVAARDHVMRIERGTILPVRVSQAIEANREDNRVYAGTVDEDIYGENGNRINGVRYAVFSDPNHVAREQNLTAGIVGTVSINQVRGPVIMVQRDTLINFQIERPLEMEAVEAA
jgi:hypothetical protein